jgi:hypothetical protein
MRPGLVTLGLAAGLVAACDSDRQAPAPEPGTDLYAVAPGAIHEVLLTSPERKMLAFRWTPDTVFHLVFAVRGRPGVEQCRAGDGFDRWLAAVSRMPVRARLHVPIDPRSGWVSLQLRDTTQLEPIDVRLRIPPGNTEPVTIQSGSPDQQYSVDVDATVLRSIESGCGALGAAAAAPQR